LYNVSKAYAKPMGRSTHGDDADSEKDMLPGKLDNSITKTVVHEVRSTQRGDGTQTPEGTFGMYGKIDG
jgi:hypothetical protein